MVSNLVEHDSCYVSIPYFCYKEQYFSIWIIVFQLSQNSKVIQVFHDNQDLELLPNEPA